MRSLYNSKCCPFAPWGLSLYVYVYVCAWKYEYVCVYMVSHDVYRCMCMCMSMCACVHVSMSGFMCVCGCTWGQISTITQKWNMIFESDLEIWIALIYLRTNAFWKFEDNFTIIFFCSNFNYTWNYLFIIEIDICSQFYINFSKITERPWFIIPKLNMINWPIGN